MLIQAGTFFSEDVFIDLKSRSEFCHVFPGSISKLGKLVVTDKQLFKCSEMQISRQAVLQ